MVKRKWEYTCSVITIRFWLLLCYNALGYSMEQNTKAPRLHALDGLRGIAILLVFLSHVNATFITRSSFLGGLVFNSGVLGVSLLFVLSGFLMAYLYPRPSSSLGFLQKRYTRIFPLFLTITVALAIPLFFPSMQAYVLLLIVLLAIVTHVIWVYVIKRYALSSFNQFLFYGFIFLQIAIGLYYIWVTQHPALYYYDQISSLQRNIIVFFVNATLMLPLGKYVTMLDPVYWSLASEVLFYVLYATICAPIINFMSPQKRVTKIILLFF